MSLRQIRLAVVLSLAALATSSALGAEELVERSRRLTGALESTVGKLTDEQREEVRAFLEAAQLVVDQAGGAAGPGACYNEAYRSLSRDIALELCEGESNHETVRCFREASPILPLAQAVRLCRQGGSFRTFVCFAQAHRELIAERSVELCEQQGTEETASCYAKARHTLTADQAVRLCRLRGTTERVACVDDQQRRLTADEAVEYCKGR